MLKNSELNVCTIISISILLLFNFVNGENKQLSLKIDSVYTSCEYVFKDSVKEYDYTFVLYWCLKNVSNEHKYISNINIPWYIYAHDVRNISRNENDTTTTFDDITGNLLIKLFIDDTIYSPSFIGFINSPGDPRKIILFREESFCGKTAATFNIEDFPDSAYLRLEYNTFYQDDYWEPIWRGEVHSQKYFLKEIEFQPCPGEN